MHPKVPEFVQDAVHVHHDHYVLHVQGHTHEEEQEGHDAHQKDLQKTEGCS
jgi:hypothetical protein